MGNPPSFLPSSYLLTKANPSKDGDAKLRDYSSKDWAKIRNVCLCCLVFRATSGGLPEANRLGAARF